MGRRAADATLPLSLAKQRNIRSRFPGEKLRFRFMNGWHGTRSNSCVSPFLQRATAREGERASEGKKRRKLINGCRHEFKSVYDFSFWNRLYSFRTTTKTFESYFRCRCASITFQINAVMEVVEHTSRSSVANCFTQNRMHNRSDELLPSSISGGETSHLRELKITRIF